MRVSESEVGETDLRMDCASVYGLYDKILMIRTKTASFISKITPSDLL